MISKQIVVQSEIAMSLEISQVFVDAILTQSRAEYPDEACGVILGPLGSDRALRIKPMINAAHSPTFYEFDPKDLLALYREVDDQDEEIVVIYHSHTDTEAYPSRTDIAYAGEPGAHYVLVSTREEIAPKAEFRSFRILNGVVTEESVEIVD
jgi:proteasome lid subunit RPN8/RPN11